MKIIIRDARGNVVRTYTENMREPSLPPPNVPQYWFEKTESVDGSAGLHRFVWNLRYEPPKALPASYYGPILQYTEYALADHAIPHESPRQQPQGPLVVPGGYTVELTVDAHTYRQPLTVKLDPRVVRNRVRRSAAVRSADAGIEEQCNALAKALALWKELNDELVKANPLNLPVDAEVPTSSRTP